MKFYSKSALVLITITSEVREKKKISLACRGMYRK